MVRLLRNKKQTYRLNSGSQIWPSSLTLAMTLTLNFQGQTWNLQYLSQKWSDCHETKSKHIDWTLGFNVTIRFDLGNDLDLWIFKVKCNLDLWPYAWCWPRIFMVKFWNSFISGWEGRLTLNKGSVSRSFMTMTIWWPRSGVRMYHIVTGVTSDVGVLSTHLVHQVKGSSCHVMQLVVCHGWCYKSSIDVNCTIREKFWFCKSLYWITWIMFLIDMSALELLQDLKIEILSDVSWMMSSSHWKVIW